MIELLERMWRQNAAVTFTGGASLITLGAFVLGALVATFPKTILVIMVLALCVCAALFVKLAYKEYK